MCLSARPILHAGVDRSWHNTPYTCAWSACALLQAKAGSRSAKKWRISGRKETGKSSSLHWWKPSSSLAMTASMPRWSLCGPGFLNLVVLSFNVHRPSRTTTGRYFPDRENLQSRCSSSKKWKPNAKKNWKEDGTQRRGCCRILVILGPSFAFLLIALVRFMWSSKQLND